MTKKRNKIMTYFQENDPSRLRDRTVKPEKGKGRKDRPRNNAWKNDSLSIAA